MKREQKREFNIEPYKSRWFWKKCEECGMEFKVEPGWRFSILTYIGFGEYCKTYVYLCRECAPTQEIA